MATADSISLSKIYLEMLEENNKFSFMEVKKEAIMEALLGRKFPFELVGSVSPVDDLPEYLTFSNTPIGKAQVADITKAYFNNSLKVAWEGKSVDSHNRALNKIKDIINVKYKELGSKYV